MDSLGGRGFAHVSRGGREERERRAAMVEV